MDIPPDWVLLYLPPARDRWFYSFACPVCGGDVHHAATREIVAMLVAAGEQAAGGGVSPEDQAPDPTAPPFTLDDLIELHFLLQDELTIPKLLHR
ncbi:MAG TPA: hypothetical protein VFZ96_09895 [Actinomycetota bacterium]|nr:hypothetical protein [Actinomycetota bacterium]